MVAIKNIFLLVALFFFTNMLAFDFISYQAPSKTVPIVYSLALPISKQMLNPGDDILTDSKPFKSSLKYSPQFSCNAANLQSTSGYPSLMIPVYQSLRNRILSAFKIGEDSCSSQRVDAAIFHSRSGVKEPGDSFFADSGAIIQGLATANVNGTGTGTTTAPPPNVITEPIPPIVTQAPPPSPLPEPSTWLLMGTLTTCIIYLKYKADKKKVRD